VSSGVRGVRGSGRESAQQLGLGIGTALPPVCVRVITLRLGTPRLEIDGESAPLYTC
jgi:hypothetical protein